MPGTSQAVIAKPCAGGVARMLGPYWATIAASIRIWIEGGVHADAYDSAVVIAKGDCRVRAADRVRVYAQNGVVVTREGPSVCVRRAGTPGGTAPWTLREAQPQ